MTPHKKTKYEIDRRRLMSVWVDIGSPKFRTICECAVGPFSLIEPMRHAADRCVLIEPDPTMAAEARVKYPWAEIVEKAVAQKDGVAKLRKLYGSSFISGIKWAPSKSHRPNAAKRAGLVSVEAVTFDKIDDGRIDFLNLDCEGSELFALQKMVSRPMLIHIELFRSHGSFKEILQWFSENRYKRYPAKLRSLNMAFVKVAE